MNVLLVDSNPAARSEIATLLRDLGFSVRPFGDAHFAFLYLLAHLGEIEAVAVNSDDGDAFLHRIDVLGPIAAITYSGSDLDGGAEIALALMPHDDSFPRGSELGFE